MAVRKDPRYPSGGQVSIAQVPNAGTIIKDVSASGLCIQSAQFLDIIPNSRYQADVIPEMDSNLDRFTINIESKWIRTKMQSSESGFVIVIPPGTPESLRLQEYLEYLAKHSSPIEEIKKS
jgi:hypothetical protein